MEKIDKEDLLYKFLHHQLAANEKAIFEKLMEEDIPFREQVDFEQKVHRAITLNERKATKEFLQSISAPVKKKSYRWIAVAASFFGVVLISAFLYSQLSRPSSEKLFLSYYQPYPNTIAPTVRGEVRASSITEAFDAYDRENYAQSAQLFDQLYESDKLSFALLYAGISYLEINKTDIAIQKFQQLKALNDDLKEVAQWYLALAFLKEDKWQLTKEYLQDLQGDTEFSQQAREILKEI